MTEVIDSQQEKLQLFISLTGTENTELALQILEQNSWDIDTSVNFYYNTNDIVDSTPSKTSTTSTSGNKSPITKDNDEDVEDIENFRDPIPQTMDTLVETSFINQYRRPPPKPTNIFESFRDFAREKDLNQNLSGKQKTLAELFKPPLDILTFGSFEDIKIQAQEKHRFVLINVQDASEFACQRLNRDTWSDAKLKELISSNFVFWQVNSTHDEGKWFIQYYPTKEYPYISIIDPRTGEELAHTYGFTDAEDMKEYLNEFISQNSYDKASKLHPSQINKNFKKKKFITEEEEIEMAIQLSLQGGSSSKSQSPTKSPTNETTKPTTTETTTKKLKTDEQQKQQQQKQVINDEIEDDEDEDEDEDEDMDTYDDLDKYDNKEEIQKIEKKSEEQPPSNIGMEGDCQIQIKLPDQLLKGNFKSTDLIKNLYYFVQIKSGKFKFKLFTTFPKVELVGDLMNKTLKEMDLTPRAQLMFQEQ
ncbi:UAS domain-containing protein [Tieghemostelium lacteum]|uniref:UAS domain-containing protein n=1 Tax=Tieghemostelium lacteum TaxID=361077 RepID=A0A152A7S4_TIELA|nr:UAS domain-containing protein [Tieghemostelium lacteum]|eukprot:KYR02258.1 UAS domain-containing protein [Tieghemostelium lacteum]